MIRITPVFIKSVLLLLFFMFMYRVGSHIPIPFINKEIFSTVFNEKSDGILQIYNLINGGSLSRMSIFTLGIMPYISASIVIFLFQLFSERVKEIASKEDGKVKLEFIKRLMTVGIVLFQSITISTVLQSQFVSGQSLTLVSGSVFYITTFLALLAGTLAVVWMANLITFIGFGSGVSLVIMFGVLSSLPENIVTIYKMFEGGGLSIISVLGFISIILVGFLVVVYFENAERRIPIIRPDRLTGQKKSHISFKANPIGIMPPIFAAISLSFPISFLQMLGESAPSFLLRVQPYLTNGSIAYIVFFSVLTFVFGIAMTNSINNPTKVAESLNSQGVVIPSKRPGKETYEYIKSVIMSLTVIGCTYLVILCSIPEFINYFMGIPFYLGGTSILIIVSTSSDMRKNIFGMLEKNNYQQLERDILG